MDGRTPDQGQATGRGWAGDHAVVIGAGVAGLTAARVLADHFAAVTVVDRDQLPDGPTHRNGVPQGHHLHVLLGRGLALLEGLFPGFQADLLECGAPTVAWSEAWWLNAAGWARPYPSTLRLVGATRGLLEYRLRARLDDLGRVAVRPGCEAVGLLADGRRHATVRGVWVRNRDRWGSVGGEQPLPADLVVDASGRRSQASGWLADLGLPPPKQVRIDAQLGYASRLYRPPDRLPPWRMLILPYAPPGRHGRVVVPSRRGGVVFPVEGGAWMVTLGGIGRDWPPTDEPGFLQFASSLRSPLLFEAIKDAQPLSPARRFRHTGNRWLRFDRVPRWPERFVVLGDAVCALNPVYAQGMTVAAAAAVTLGQALTRQRQRAARGDLTGLAGRCQRQAARCSRAAWLLATGEDVRYLAAGRLPPTVRLLHRYGDAVLRVANGNPTVQPAVLDVLHLQAPLATLVAPRVLLPVLAGRYQPPLPGPPWPPATPAARAGR